MALPTLTLRRPRDGLAVNRPLSSRHAQHGPDRIRRPLGRLGRGPAALSLGGLLWALCGLPPASATLTLRRPGGRVAVRPLAALSCVAPPKRFGSGPWRGRATASDYAGSPCDHLPRRETWRLLRARDSVHKNSKRFVNGGT